MSTKTKTQKKKHPCFAVASLGKGRWYWVVWPSMQWQFDAEVVHLAEGIAPTKADAVDEALDRAGMHGEWMAAKFAQEYRRASRNDGDSGRMASPTRTEFLHRDVFDPDSDTWFSVRHRVIRRTPKFVFVDQAPYDSTPTDVADSGDNGKSDAETATFRLRRADLERNGYTFMPVVDGLIDDPVFFTTPWQERMMQYDDLPDCFALLGLQPPCSADDVRRAFRQQAKQIHPDQGGDHDEFLALQAAYKQALRLSVSA